MKNEVGFTHLHDDLISDAAVTVENRVLEPLELIVGTWREREGIVTPKDGRRSSFHFRQHDVRHGCAVAEDAERDGMEKHGIEISRKV